MDCNLIFKRYHAKYFPFKFFNFPPKSEAIILLRLNLNRMFNYLNTPLFFKI